VALAPPGIPRLDEIGLDAQVVTFAVAVLAGTAIIFGLTPAVRATRLDVTTAMKEGSRGGGSKRGGRTALVVSEVALALMLLTGAGLLMRSFATAARWHPGFEYENLATLWLLGSSTKYTSGRQVVRVFHDVVDAVEALPDVRAAGTASAGPLFGGREPGEFVIAGRPASAPDERPQARWFDIGPQYFRTLGLPVLRGRDFTAADDEGAPRVAIINEAMARRYWPDEDPLGQFVQPALGWTSDAAPMEIVGVVGDVTPFDPNVPAEAEIYWPNSQRPRLATYLVIRTTGAPEAAFEAVRARIQAVDPSMSVGRTATIEAMMGSQLVRPRFQMLLLGVFAAVALALATVGTYGVISYGVSGRTHEFGLRMSLGAHRRDSLRLVIAEGVRIGGVGVVVGLAGGLAVSRVMSSMLIGIAPRDVVTFVAAPVAMGLVVMLACYLPARRAAGIHPMVAMRTE
jgi:putative ABC transport system permease protein